MMPNYVCVCVCVHIHIHIAVCFVYIKRGPGKHSDNQTTDPCASESVNGIFSFIPGESIMFSACLNSLVLE